MYIKYLLSIFLLSLLGLCFTLFLALHTVQRNPELLQFKYARLVSFQKEKIRTADRVDIAIVGDSSGANAIDAALMSKLLDKEVVSLSLTGVFGFAGSYAMARQAVEKGAKIIWLVHTVDILQRGVDQGKKASVFLGTSVFDLFENKETLPFVIPLLLSSDIVKQSYISFFNTIVGRRQGEFYEDFAANDYVQQREEQVNLKGKVLEWPVGRIKKDKIFYLKQLVQYCDARQVDCLYSYGPIHESFCEKSQEYLKYSNELIVSTGVVLLSERPYCMSNTEVGDTEDHIAPILKPYLTKFYLEQFYKHYSSAN